MPVVCFPRPVLRARVQPVAVGELAQAVVALLGRESAWQGLIPCTGPEPVAMADLIASLRAQCGRRPARTAVLPDLLTQWSARWGDALPASPWCSETLALLGSDNVGDAGALCRLLGHEGVHYRDLVDRAWRQA